MFSKLFGKKTFDRIEQPLNAITLLGNVEGAGVNSLRIALVARLRSFSGVANAYLAKIQYVEEDELRVGLAIDAPSISEVEKGEIASRCSGVVPMDILFLDSLPDSIVASLRSSYTPLFVPDLKLFECPIRVTRGSNSEMPTEWKGAIIFFYVASSSYQEALLTAVAQLRAEGYEYQTVANGKVNQLDPSVWWSGFVMEKWSEHAAHFPSQSDLEALVAAGGYFRGPVLGWAHDSEA
ncbi:hypothetical protein [Jeongeupia naejangsanensis]|uniref:Uncharacterized protein n=1 Tax=Jeongeupia naejangsanensis TaxID=613195 RepID=A0ABS2BKD6_9NEIS|nr:hypothetical protein [Jeongeupia naejangsanensis]MBM3116077.1 hypothetical protein [Jeongeupia naejangsanensis]